MPDIRADISFATVQKAHTRPNDSNRTALEIDSFQYSFEVNPLSRDALSSGWRLPEKTSLLLDLEMHVHDAANAPSFLEAIYSNDFFEFALYLHSSDAENAPTVFSLTGLETRVTSVSHSASENDVKAGFTAHLRLFHGYLEGNGQNYDGEAAKAKSAKFEFGRSLR